MKTHFAILFKSLFLGTITPLVISCTHGQTTERLLPYIDTRMGTAASITHTAGMFGKHTEEYGQTLPAVLEPNGMNFWTPQTQDTEQNASHLIITVTPCFKASAIRTGLQEDAPRITVL